MVNPKRALSGLIRAAAFAGCLVAAAAAVAKPAYKIEAIPAAGDYVPHAARAINSKSQAAIGNHTNDGLKIKTAASRTARTP